MTDTLFHDWALRRSRSPARPPRAIRVRPQSVRVAAQLMDRLPIRNREMTIRALRGQPAARLRPRLIPNQGVQNVACRKGARRNGPFLASTGRGDPHAPTLSADRRRPRS